MIVAAANFQLRGSGLAELLDRQPKISIAGFGVHYSAHCVALGTEVQDALVVLARYRVVRLEEIENDGTVFQNDGVARAAEEIFEHLAQGFGSHVRIFRGHLACVCDR